MNCPLCIDGFVFHEGGTFVCPCPIGEKHRVDLFSPSDTKKERPIRLPLWGTVVPRRMTDARELATGESGED